MKLVLVSDHATVSGGASAVANPVLIDPCSPASPAEHRAVVMVGAITKGKGAFHALSLTQALCRLQDDALVSRLGSTAHARYWQAPRTLIQHGAQLEKVYREVMA